MFGTKMSKPMMFKHNLSWSLLELSSFEVLQLNDV